MENVKALVWLTQLGLSMAMPLLVFVPLGAWLQSRFSLGAWVVIVGIVLGLIGAVSAGKSFYRHSKTARDAQRKKAPVGFSQHD